MKQFKWPTSLISHWFPVEMVHNGPKLSKRRRPFLCCKTFSEVSIHRWKVVRIFMTHPDRFLNTSWHCVLPWSIACSLLWFENNCLRSWGCFDIYLFKDQIFIKIKSVLNKFWEKLIKVLKLKGDETKSRFEINHLIRSALKVSPEYEEINDNGGGDG